MPLATRVGLSFHPLCAYLHGWMDVQVHICVHMLMEARGQIRVLFLRSSLHLFLLLLLLLFWDISPPPDHAE